MSIFSQNRQNVKLVYPSTAIHKFKEEALREGCINGMEELIISGEKYKVQQDNEGNYFLIRYNEKYKTWVKLCFTSEADNLQMMIIEALKKQFIDRVIEKSC